MKTRTIILLFLILNIQQIQAQQIRKFLFLGNSYTQVNDLPKMVHDVAKGMGDSVFYDSNTPGGYTFQGHSTNITSISKIQSQSWDYVVLQEQSQIPSLSPLQVATDCFPYAQKLDSIIVANNNCTETVFYMTWGRKNGDATFCGSYPPVCTYEGMQERLRQSYLQMGTDNSATVAPVGMAWYKARLQNPSFDLWMVDESHPSIYGTYLTACVFYATLFHKSPENCPFISTISPADAAFLQQIAAITVFDSLDQWAVPGDIAYARFTYDAAGTSVQFNDSSINATTWNWDFGDGQFSSLKDPQHNYATPGIYFVSLVVNNNCFEDTITDSLNLSSVGFYPIHDAGFIKVYPNPFSDYFYLEIPPDFINAQYKIYNTAGILIKEFSGNYNSPVKVNVQDLQDGLFLLRINILEAKHDFLLFKSH